MKRKLNVISMILGILFVLGVIFFVTVHYRVKNNEKPISRIDYPAGEILNVVTEQEINIYNKVTTIDIESAFENDESIKKEYTLNQEEIYQIFDIIDNANFTKESEQSANELEFKSTSLKSISERLIPEKSTSLRSTSSCSCFHSLNFSGYFCNNSTNSSFV